MSWVQGLVIVTLSSPSTRVLLPPLGARCNRQASPRSITPARKQARRRLHFCLVSSCRVRFLCTLVCLDAL
ncbi:hypothetical protein DFP72DRAFT_927595 [Ephemerocybe angulata]|uniref:Uncharacterized protein n=1 Tax=Ephemerocybe angulata TaxID=980116 RepID=A0A8H6LW17_9AGAR|nr:hypothetical protein DFP72DRAFT_927595 [Tulosesus angulatus]